MLLYARFCRFWICTYHAACCSRCRWQWCCCMVQFKAVKHNFTPMTRIWAVVPFFCRKICSSTFLFPFTCQSVQCFSSRWDSWISLLANRYVIDIYSHRICCEVLSGVLPCHRFGIWVVRITVHNVQRYHSVPKCHQVHLIVFRECERVFGVGVQILLGYGCVVG
jgi:hypothetical protein